MAVAVAVVVVLEVIIVEAIDEGEKKREEGESSRGKLRMDCE